MPVKSIPLRVKMTGDVQVENITRQIEQALTESRLKDGIVTVFAKHTTASVLIIEDEPGIRADTKTLWERLVPADPKWQHNTRNPGEDNAHSHLRAQLQGVSQTVPFTDGRLTLGTWQQLVLIDYDTRSRTRELIVQIVGE